jgi:C4-dicarboxylate-specific signal transduction histidine kinase
MLERIFDPFVTTRKHGTGLDAPLHRRRRAGRLNAANRPTGGAVFTVEFPPGSARFAPATA